MNLKTFLEGRKGLRNIRRFGMEFTLQDQNLAEHGFFVGSLTYLICKSRGIEITSEELFKVMNHDFAETRTGDLNKLVKNEVGDEWEDVEEKLCKDIPGYTDTGLILSISSPVLEVLRLCDAIDAVLYCIEEESLGNSRLHEAKMYYKSIIHSMVWEAESYIIDYIEEKQI